MTRAVCTIIVVGWVVQARAQEPPSPLRETTVGMTGRIDGLVLSGAELEPKPYDDRKRPVVLRVIRVSPHGTALRYDLEYYGLDPGTYDLRDYLRRKDGSPTADLQPLPVKVNAVRPPGQAEPNALVIEPGPRVGGYRQLLLAVGVLWAVGFLAIVASFFFPRRRKAAEAVEKPVSLADRLRPLVEGAIAGTLARAELAALERSLLALWRKRLGLEAADPAEAIAALRRHPDAEPLLAQLEAWLHRPGPPDPVDVPALLRPYRDLPPDAAELPTTEPPQGVAR